MNLRCRGISLFVQCGRPQQCGCAVFPSIRVSLRSQVPPFHETYASCTIFFRRKTFLFRYYRRSLHFVWRSVPVLSLETPSVCHLHEWLYAAVLALNDNLLLLSPFFNCIMPYPRKCQANLIYWAIVLALALPTQQGCHAPFRGKAKYYSAMFKGLSPALHKSGKAESKRRWTNIMSHNLSVTVTSQYSIPKWYNGLHSAGDALDIFDTDFIALLPSSPTL